MTFDSFVVIRKQMLAGGGPWFHGGFMGVLLMHVGMLTSLVGTVYISGFNLANKQLRHVLPGPVPAWRLQVYVAPLQDAMHMHECRWRWAHFPIAAFAWSCAFAHLPGHFGLRAKLLTTTGG